MIETTNRPARSKTRAAVAVAAVLIVAAAGIIAVTSQRPDEKRTTPVAALTSQLTGLHLQPGIYTFTSQDLGSEVTTDSGDVIRPATATAPIESTLEFQSPDSWVERSADGSRLFTRRDGMFRSVIDGKEVEPAAQNKEASDAARAAGSSMPDGGTRIELNPYGASFLLRTARAEVTEAKNNGLSGSEVTSNVDCGRLMCTQSVFERQLRQPPDDAEYTRSLPWKDVNVERVTVVYEPDTNIVHGYETVFNDASVLHRFTLTAWPGQ